MVMFGSNFSGRSLRAIFLLLGVLLATVPFTDAVFASDANGAAAPADNAAARQAKIHELMMLLAQQWLDEQGTAKAPAPAPPEHELPVVDFLNSSASGIHEQIVAFAQEIPHFPDEFRAAIGRLVAIDWKDALWRLVIFVVVVAGAEWLAPSPCSLTAGTSTWSILPRGIRSSRISYAGY
jgi:hypothetical protein